MDQKLLFLINQEWISPMLDWFMMAISNEAIWKYPLIFAVVAAVLWGGFRARAFAIVALFAFGINDGLVGRSLKYAANRLRRRDVDPNVRVVTMAKKSDGKLVPPGKGLFLAPSISQPVLVGLREQGRSFPSNHASNTAAVALLVALFWRRWGWLAFVPSTIVAYSRVYVGAHWPTDVIAGILLGLGVSFMTFALFESLWRRFGRRLAPDVATRHPSLLTA